MVEEDDLEKCTKEQRDLFTCNIRGREVVLLPLPENKYSQVKYLKTSHEIWKALEANYEGDTHAKELDIEFDFCISG